MIIHSTDAIQSIHSDYSNKLISEAINCLEKRIRRATLSLNHSQDVCAFLRLHLAVEKHEVFAVSFLDSRHRLIQFEKLFHGTINEAAVYPRRVVEKALEYNAAAVILAHNHPSQDCNPSLADRVVTRELRTILKIINVKVLDHIIVSHRDSYHLLNMVYFNVETIEPYKEFNPCAAFDFKTQRRQYGQFFCPW